MLSLVAATNKDKQECLSALYDISINLVEELPRGEYMDVEFELFKLYH
jgi:hypothetical protein